MRVTDSGGRVSLSSVVITVGNTAPIVEIITPENGSFTDWGDKVAFEVKVTDPEETIDCSRVLWSYGLGHDNTHAHPLFTGSGCTATIETQSEAGHGETENIYGHDRRLVHGRRHRHRAGAVGRRRDAPQPARAAGRARRRLERHLDRRRRDRPRVPARSPRSTPATGWRTTR